MSKMRACWKETRDAQKALKMINDQHSTYVESKLLSALVKYNNNGSYNYLQALQMLPKNMLMLYTHAYQSLIFNQVVSKRRELGLSVLEGDLVFRDVTNAVDQEAVIIEEVTDAENENIIDTTESESKFKEMVRPLTKEDVESGKYSIFDIVLVLPGHDITYPSNSIGDYYQELMSKDDLSSEKLKSKHK
jgi:tRNA pseudouridine13 synthase